MPRRKIEILSAGCPLCEQTTELIRQVGGEFCDITVLNVRDERVAERARALGLRTFPAIIIDDKPLEFDLFAALSQAFSESEWVRQSLKRVLD